MDGLFLLLLSSSSSLPFLPLLPESVLPTCLAPTILSSASPSPAVLAAGPVVVTDIVASKDGELIADVSVALVDICTGCLFPTAPSLSSRLPGSSLYPHPRMKGMPGSTADSAVSVVRVVLNRTGSDVLQAGLSRPDDDGDNPVDGRVRAVVPQPVDLTLLAETLLRIIITPLTLALLLRAPGVLVRGLGPGYRPSLPTG